MARTASFASLTPALIRRADPSFDDCRGDVDGAVPDPAIAAAGWRDDLQLFAITWAAGFVFFLTLLA